MNGNRHISTPSLGLRHQLQALVDSGASPNLVVAGAKAAVADAKKQNEENTEKNKKSNMSILCFFDWHYPLKTYHSNIH